MIFHKTGWCFFAYPSEKYEFVNWDDELPTIWENEKCSKPPISIDDRFQSKLYSMGWLLGKSTPETSQIVP